MRGLLEKISTGPVGGKGDEIKPGGCIASYAVKNGMSWEHLWDFKGNRSLKITRRHPGILLPSDTIAIPEKETSQGEKNVDKEYTFFRKGLTCEVQLRFTAFGAPRADEEYKTFNGKKELAKGKTDARGMITVKFPIEGCSKITVQLGKNKEDFEFELGTLPPATEPRGIQARLWNLGYYSGEFSDEFTAETEAALRRFMFKNGLINDEYEAAADLMLKNGLSYLVNAHGS